MIRTALCAAALLAALAAPAAAGFETDTIATSAGDLAITFIGHGTLMFTVGGRTVHVDPWTRLADYSALPKADLVLLTHAHRDHLDPDALAAVRTEATAVVMPAVCAEDVESGVVMGNGETAEAAGFAIEAVPMYNIVHLRKDGSPFHEKGVGNGYVVQIGDTRLYIAGDTENTPEMKALEEIDIAFLPMNLPYTMTPEMVADAARAFRPRILYPYHFGDTDTATLVELLKDETDIEVRIRRME
ncbi:MAG: MBL fold metallo-hydrolase [Candidatus Krumholzibacteriota bacterium]|nr:MBL fold metallo-hydrolase [Candidatus Krumholzibacteriota bacterium]